MVKKTYNIAFSKGLALPRGTRPEAEAEFLKSAFRSGASERGSAASQARRGVVLLAVLVVVAILSLGAYTFFQAMIVEARASQMHGRSAQTQLLADSGVELAMVLLADPTLLEQLGGNLYDNPIFADVVVRDDDRARWRGRFSILAPREGDVTGQAVRFGLSDESAKINLNSLLRLDPQGEHAAQMLLALPEMTADLADAILDWLDADSQPRMFGAEDDYYGSLQPAYPAKNGPLETLEELLMIRGVTPGHLFGEDANRNGLLDGNEDDGSLRWPDDDADGTLDSGWLPYLTLYSREANRSADGRPRINLNNADQDALGKQLEAEFGSGMAQFVRLYRQFGPYQDPSAGGGSSAPAGGRSSQGGGGRGGGGGDGNYQFASILDLIDARVQDRSAQQQPGGGGGGGPQPVRAEGASTPVVVQGPPGGGATSPTPPAGQSTGRENVEAPIVDSPFRSENLRDFLPQLYDRLTTRNDPVIEGRVNVNLASPAVLLGLPGMDEGLVQRMVTARAAAGADDEAYATPAWLLIEGILTLEQMKELDSWITTRGGVYRMQVVGYFEEGGPTARIEAGIDASGSGPPRLLFWRDLSSLGQGFYRGQP